jgi:poly(3-hydroxyalkanoate) depolymerase
MKCKWAKGLWRAAPIARWFRGNMQTEIRTVDVEGQSLRVGIKPGKGPPLLIFNGIGASFELLEPFTRALGDLETIVFDVPGVGGSALPDRPYRFSGLARLVDRMLKQLGYESEIDALGVSWGGAAAQQFAYTCRQRCRRLILAATSPGVLMIPGRLSLLRRMFDARRYSDPQYMTRIAAELYGGALRREPRLIAEFAKHMKPPNRLGYLYQQMAFLGWTSLRWLPLLRQPTLVLAGNDDPLVPQLNGRILRFLIPKARLHIVDDGHLFLITGALQVAPIVREFLSSHAETQ